METQLDFSQQLIEVAHIMDQWQVMPKEWWFIGETALRLGGYQMPWESVALDVAVLADKLDWQSGTTGERSMLPPAGSMEFETYIRQVTKIGKSVEVFAANTLPNELKTVVLDGREIYYLTPLAQVGFYTYSIAKAKKKEDFFTKHKERWRQRLDTIWKAAIEKNDKEMATLTEKLIKELNS